MKFFTIMNPFFDAPGDGGSGGGTGDGSTGAGASGQPQTTGSASSSSQSTGTQTQSTSGQSSTQTGTGPTSGAHTPQFDPKDYIPRHRLNEVSSENKTLKEQVADLNRRLTLALGGDITSPEAQKAQQIKEAFFNLPGMGVLKKLADNLSEEQLEQLLSVPQQLGGTREAEARQWQRYGNQVIDSVSERVAEAFGTDKLDDDQKSDLRENFSAWIRNRARNELNQAVDRYGLEAVQADERRFSPTIQAYEDGDQKLLSEFVTRYTKNWVEPARRSATAKQSTRTRPTPDGSGRAAVSSIQRPEKFNSLEERLDFAVKLAKERGMQFGR